MTAAVPRFATDDDHALLDGYARFCHEIGLSDRALRDRLRLARAFLACHPDLGVWMTRPTRTRLADLSRIRAWSFLSWVGLAGRVQLDLDLLCAKNFGSMSATIRQLQPETFEGLWATARRLGWSYHWSRSVIDQFVPGVLAFSATKIEEISAELLDTFEQALGKVESASATTRRQWSGRSDSASSCSRTDSSMPRPSVAFVAHRSQSGSPRCRQATSAARSSATSRLVLRCSRVRQSTVSWATSFPSAAFLASTSPKSPR